MQIEDDWVIKGITDFLDCEYEIMRDIPSGLQLTDKYTELLLQGKLEGFIPLIIVPSMVLAETLEMCLEEGEADRASIIEAAGHIDAESYLAKILENSPEDMVSFYSHTDAPPYSGTPTVTFEGLLGYSRNEADQLIIARVPTDKPWELAAWVPMGGFNACPLPKDQVAVFKHWHEKYGAVPAAVSGDIWNLYVQNPVRDDADCMKLAIEQFAFCEDIVSQGTESLPALAAGLAHSTVWFFWWD